MRGRPAGPVLESLRNRLVIEWGAGSIKWSRLGAAAAPLPVVEIADPTVVPALGMGQYCFPLTSCRRLWLTVSTSRGRLH